MLRNNSNVALFRTTEGEKETAAQEAAEAAAAVAEAENLALMVAATEGAAGLLSTTRAVYPSSIFVTVGKTAVLDHGGTWK